MIRRRALTILVAGAILAPAPGVAWAQTPADVPPGIGIGLAEAPTAVRDDPRAHVYIVDHVAPGASFDRRFRVSNGTDDTVTLSVYPVAATIEGGSFVVREGRSANDLTTWIRVQPDSVRLPPRSMQELTLTISTPPDAAPGEHYAAVVAELPPRGSGSVGIATRVGLRVYLSVGGDGEPASDFEIHSLVAARDRDGVPVVRAQVENTGGRALDMRGELTLGDGPAGLSAGPFQAELGTTLAPGDSAPVIVVLDPEIPNGPWRARMVARSGTLEKAVEATITFPDAPGESSPVAATPLHRDRGLLIPLAVGLLLLALLMLLLFWWRRRRRDEDEPERARPMATAGPR